MVAASLLQFIRERARHRCEYCLLPEKFANRQFQIDHILARQHTDDDSPENLALACDRCNSFKGPNIAGIDPKTRAITPLFNPRTDHWPDHFAWQGVTLAGVSPVGRTTVHVLNLNEYSMVAARTVLMRLGFFFP